jgi:hypothetical protein
MGKIPVKPSPYMFGSGHWDADCDPVADLKVCIEAMYKQRRLTLWQRIKDYFGKWVWIIRHWWHQEVGQ